MNLKIRAAAEKDIAGIIDLIHEFAKFEDLEEFLEVTSGNLSEVMFGESGFVSGLVALDGEKHIGYALFYPAFLSFRGQRSVYLEDLFISGRYRKFGIGEKLVREVARQGKKFGAVRMDLQVLDWNLPAIDFYQKHGAAMDSDERHFKFVDQAFEELSA